MRENVTVAKTMPAIEPILERQGIPRGVTPADRIVDLAKQAVTIYGQLAEPSALYGEITCDEFDNVYSGEGMNDMHTPMADIFRVSSSMAMFAVTVGQPVCEAISNLFEQGDYALASMLDAAASESAEATAQSVQDHYERYLRAGDRLDSGAAVMRFSPGYCGWNVSGQKKLFAYLNPEEIGIELSESFLMHPLKSVSGVIVAGPRDIFDIDDNYPFCGECDTHECRDRFHAVARQVNRQEN